MRQLLQYLVDGRTEIATVPVPAANTRELLLSTSRTLISSGTERMLVEFGKAGMIGKARQQPEKVRMVLDKVKADGLLATLDSVRAKLDLPIPLGYCHVGRVVGVGSDIKGFAEGDRVASNARHAEMDVVPANLAVKIPDTVSDEDAAFTVPGAIALQGIRLVAPSLGESVVVIGLGLIGLISVQLLLLHGCRVLGIDTDQARVELASKLGAQTALIGRDDPLASAETLAKGRGVDAVVITAATQSNEPVKQAATMCRKRGRIVLVGVVGLELSRADFYEKEISFQVSCSYGPGRYDPAYEQDGQDYPFGFVRWTAKRNFEAVLDMMADGRLDVSPLISHRFEFADAAKAYDLISSSEPSLGVLLEYGQVEPAARSRTVDLTPASQRLTEAAPVQLAMIGAGGHAVRTLMSAFRDAGAGLCQVVTRSGASGHYAAKKFGFAQATTELTVAFDDPTTNTVVIGTRHDSHADLVCRGLTAGKHVFVEKPLCLTCDELVRIERAANANPSQLLMVGFNRRFAPQIVALANAISPIQQPKSLVITVNAGQLSDDHWTVDPKVGGGRIIGEACHFIDLARYLVGFPIVSGQLIHTDDDANNASISLTMSDGSIAIVHYLTNGHRGFPKERVEVFAGGAVWTLDNFLVLKAIGSRALKPRRLWRQDKGHLHCAQAFVNSIEQGTDSPISRSQIIEVSKVAIELATKGAYQS